MAAGRNGVLLAVLLCVSMSSVWTFVEELNDSFMETLGQDEIWLIKFYAPWCSFCKQLDPVWHQLGSELRSLGSPVSVAKADATASPGLAKEFGVRTYPAIFMLKGDRRYIYQGPRTKEDIMEFAGRVAGPAVRSLTSLQLFQHAMGRHDVLFVYVGGTSVLRGNYSAAAEELLVHTSFFSAAREVLPKAVSISSLPAVVVFKDGTYFIYDADHDGELKSWLNRERFPSFQAVDAYTLYAMGDSGKLVLLALLEEAEPSERGLRYKNLVETAAADHSDAYRRRVLFGFMAGGGYVSGLLMGEVDLPSIILLDLATDSYFLPPAVPETERHLLDFLDRALDGRLQPQGGNGVAQRVRRFVYDTRVTLTPVFREAPLLGYFLVGFPLSVAVFFCFLFSKARRAIRESDGDDKKRD